MSELRDAFDRLLGEHRRIGSPCPDRLSDGRPEAEIRRRLGALALDPPSDLVEYFEIQDGIDNGVWSSEHGGSDLYLAPFSRSPSLPEAIERYEAARDISVDLFGPEPRLAGQVPEAGYWAATWFPLFIGDVTYASDCRGGERSLVWAQSSHPGDPTSPIFSSISELIDDIVDRFRHEIIMWRPDWQAFTRNDVAAMRRDADCRAKAAGLDPHGTY